MVQIEAMPQKTGAGRSMDWEARTEYPGSKNTMLRDGLQYHKDDITNGRKDGILSSPMLTLSHMSQARITSSVSASETAITHRGSEDASVTVLLL